jgi:prepilin-type N-terminal cleavage/methylation domain-containing protein/prepilin-type processing-associated H-X9-DG protein
MKATKLSNGRLRLNKACRCGFTLIELLTALLIVGIVMAILFTLISSVRVNAKIAQSTSNLRAIGMTIQLYRLNNNGAYPTTTERIWIDSLWPYSNPNQEPISFGASSPPTVFKNTIYYTPMVEDNPRARSFGYNYIVNYGIDDGLYQYADSARICLVADSTNSSSLSPKQINFRNRGKANILFVDGHVEMRTREEVPDSNFTYFWRGVQPVGSN